MNFGMLFATLVVFFIGMMYLFVPKHDHDVYFGVAYLTTSLFLGIILLDDLINDNLKTQLQKLSEVREN